MIKFPFMNAQQLNLDWIMQKLRTILDFMPIDQGAVGDVLQRGTNGATWQPLTSVVYDINGMTPAAEVTATDEIPIYDVSAQGNYKVTVQDVLDLAAAAPVSSVNGQTGAVVLDADDVGALSDTTPIPNKTSDLNNDSGFVDAAGAASAAPVQSVNSKTGTVVLSKSDIGLGNVDNVQQYSANNQPPYPVTSVNGQTGDVVITPGGGMEATLLWTNSAPTSTFAAQTVAIDLSDCKFVLIEYSQDYGFVTSTVMFPVPTITPSPGYSAYNVYMNLNWVSSQFTIFQRRCEITAAGIVFEDATEFTAYNTSASTSTNNNLGVPKRIWGIK